MQMVNQRPIKRLLVVVDMQNDFITGALANPDGQKIVGKVADYIRNFDGHIVLTQDTHFENYSETQEGKRLPVPHCICYTNGWNLVPEIQKAIELRSNVYSGTKDTFGSVQLGKFISGMGYDEIYFVGVCTDICVISNAILCKAFAPEARIIVLKDLCAGVTPESHEAALKAMQACQIDVE